MPNPTRHTRYRRGVRIAALVLLSAAALAGDPARAAPAAQSDDGVTYRLADTWRQEPWSLEAGRFGRTIDVSSAPDGTIYVLDGQNRAVHALRPDGAPIDVFLVPEATADDRWQPRRLDVGFDGRLYLVVDGYRDADGPYRTRIDRLSPEGVLEHVFEVHANVPEAYEDIAVRDDGRIYLSRNGPGSPFIQWPGPTPTPSADGVPTHAVEVYSRDGLHLETLAPPELGVPGGLDVARDGTIWVINRVPTPWSEPPEGPTPTPRPSYGAPDRAAQAEVEPIEGVLVFEPDHRVRETVRFTSAEDIAVGPAGVFVSRNVEIFDLFEAEPLYIGPTARIYAAYFRRVALSLDAPADGRLLAGLNHCYFQGVARFDDPAARPATPAYVGRNDAPFLEGPPYPLRLSADDEIAVLQGRYFGSGYPPERFYASSNYLMDPQTVQRWTRYGQSGTASPLQSQFGVCSGSDAWWTRDVAVDGTDVYTADPNLVQLRPDDGLPAWTAWPAGSLSPDDTSKLTAIDARSGVAVVLDAGARRVHVIEASGAVAGSWRFGADDENALPADIALGDGVVYLADLGRGRIDAYDLDGTPRDSIRTHDGPASIDVGPDGSLFMLGRGGWGFRYAADGRLAASWPMPDRSLEALDLTVDTDGRVYVSFIESDALGAPSAGRSIVLFDILQSGIWVFEETPASPIPPTDPDACVARPDKWAAPRSLPLGAETKVTLTVEGRCPGRYDPLQLVVLLDSSRSMNFDNAIDRARDALGILLSRLDPEAAEVGLVTFEEGASLVVPLGREIGEVAAQLGAQETWGDTRLAAGVELAHQQLLPPRGNPAARRVILLVSDGVFNDDPAEAAASARADGIEIYSLILPTYEYSPIRHEAIEALSGEPNRVLVDPDPAALLALVDGMVHYRAEPGLFQTVTIDDVVPDNMRYVVGSAVPPGLWDASRRTLSWTFENVAAAAPITLSYRLEPLETGTWPTNVEATADYVDALGGLGDLLFPVPQVDVWALDKPIYLPFAASRSCFRGAKPMDVVLILDTSTSMTDPAASGGTKLDAARSAARTFLGLLRWPPDRAAVVSFDTAATRHTDLTGDVRALDAALGALEASVGTHIDLGLAEARAVLADRRPDAVAVAILLTDGLNNAGPEPVLERASALKAEGTVLYAIGLGSDVDADLLRRAATSPDRYFASPTPEDLEAIYRQVLGRLACEP